MNQKSHVKQGQTSEESGAGLSSEQASPEEVMGLRDAPHHYIATIEDFEKGTIQVKEMRGRLATSGDAVLQSNGPLTDQEIEGWIGRLALDEWAAPEGRHHSDLTVQIHREPEPALDEAKAVGLPSGSSPLWAKQLKAATELIERLEVEAKGQPHAGLDRARLDYAGSVIQYSQVLAGLLRHHKDMEDMRAGTILLSDFLRHATKKLSL